MFHMQRHRRLPEEHARFYSAEICLALNFLHERGEHTHYKPQTPFPACGDSSPCENYSVVLVN